MRKIKFWPILLLVLAGAVLLSLPTMNNNIGDPNLLLYFNNDQGYSMDLMWFYYTGERPDFFQIEADYGLEMRYIVDLARLIFSKFVDFKPGSFVLILRWLHLIGWICALTALWRMVSYHFGKNWQPALAVMLVGVRPAFAYFSVNLKPEPLVLFFMIVGLDYTLRIIKDPFRRSNFVIATACAAAAFLIKYAGIFLLPPIIASMFFAERYHRDTAGKKIIFPKMKFSWIFLSVIGLFMMLLSLLVVFCYVRRSTGLTCYEEFGLLGVLQNKKALSCIAIIGILMIFASQVLVFLEKIKSPVCRKVTANMREFNSYALIAFGAFAVFIILFGFRWVIAPKHFLTIYAQMGPALTTTWLETVISGKALIFSFFRNVLKKITNLDPVIFSLFLFYVMLAIRERKQNPGKRPLIFFKRQVLLIFLVPPFLAMFYMLRMTPNHMLPFFTAMSVLAIQSIPMLEADLNFGKKLKHALLVLICVLFSIDIFFNATDMIKSRLYQFRQHEAVVFDIAKWLRKNIPPDAVIAAEHPTIAYIPPEYKNVKIFAGSQKEKIMQLRGLADTYRPEFIYCRENPSREKTMPPIKEVLPGKNIQLIKYFDGTGRRYQRNPGSRFAIYKISYSNTEA